MRFARPRGRWQETAARGWHWLDQHGWLTDNPSLGESSRSVFENFGPRRLITLTLASLLLYAPLCMPAFVVHDQRIGSPVSFLVPVVGSLLAFLWTFGALARGHRERSVRDVDAASVIAYGAAAGVAFGALIRSPHGSRLGALAAALLLPAGPYLWVFAFRRCWRATTARMAARAAQLARDAQERERQEHALTAARLQLLEAQAEPHFMFNALSSLDALVDHNPHRAARAAAALARYLGDAIPKARTASTLADELELVEAYLEVMGTRMRPRLAWGVEADPACVAQPFPSLVLATLVENAIKHGLEPKAGGGRIDVRAQRVESRIVVTVSDDGEGFGATSGAGVGLANARSRLRALYDGGAALDVEANDPHGVIARITLPWRHDAGAGR